MVQETMHVTAATAGTLNGWAWIALQDSWTSCPHLYPSLTYVFYHDNWRDFRRVVQVHLSTSNVDIELSQYIKRELHSLHNYLLTSFTSKDIAAFSRHFAKVRPWDNLSASIGTLA